MAGPVGAQSDAGQINSIFVNTASALSSSRNGLRGYDPFIHPSRFYNIKLLKPIMCFVVIYVGMNTTVEAVLAV